MAAVQEGRVELELLEKAPVRPSEEAREVVQVVMVVSERAEAVAAVQEGGAEVGVLDGAQVRGGSVSLGLSIEFLKGVGSGKWVSSFSETFLRNMSISPPSGGAEAWEPI